MLRFVFLLVAAVTFMPAFANEFNGKVVGVIDGNTLEIKSDDNEIYQVMLHEIDCPEIGQAFGEQAKRFLEKLLMSEEVMVRITGKDRWGNNLAVVLVDGDVDVRHEILKEGLAWTAERNPNPELEILKNRAKDKSLGLWKEQEPTPPWIFRRQQTMLKPKGG